MTNIISVGTLFSDRELGALISGFLGILTEGRGLAAVGKGRGPSSPDLAGGGGTPLDSTCVASFELSRAVVFSSEYGLGGVGGADLGTTGGGRWMGLMGGELVTSSPGALCGFEGGGGRSCSAVGADSVFTNRSVVWGGGLLSPSMLEDLSSLVGLVVVVVMVEGGVVGVGVDSTLTNGSGVWGGGLLSPSMLEDLSSLVGLVVVVVMVEGGVVGVGGFSSWVSWNSQSQHSIMVSTSLVCIAVSTIRPLCTVSHTQMKITPRFNNYMMMHNG